MAPSHLKQLKASIQQRRTASAQSPAKQGQHGATAGHTPRHQSHAQTKSGVTLLPAAQRAPHQQGHKKPLRRPKTDAEALRRRTLLTELQGRHKVGGIVDRRIGEDDPTLAPEERALKRFVARQKGRRGDVFDLEGSGGEEGGLTHLGMPVEGLDDFDEEVGGGDRSDGEEGDLFTKVEKRRREVQEDGADDEELEVDEPIRKKSKKEVMEEVIAKSKFHKYERQQAKEEDDVLREELDKGMSDLMALLRGGRVKPAPLPVPVPEPPTSNMHPDRAAMMDGVEKTRLTEKEYDKNLRQMVLEKRAKPAERTKTEEEKAAEEVTRLKELEEKRQRRMRGEEESSESGESEKGREADGVDGQMDEEMANEAAEFGLQEPTQRAKRTAQELDVEDEDEFIIDEDLVASGSDLDSDLSSGDEESAAEDFPDEDDAEFLQDVLDGKPSSSNAKEDTTMSEDISGGSKQLAYTYPCPRSHRELLDVLNGTSISDLPVIIQRIRALYHPQLQAENKEKLADFSRALVTHLSYLGIMKPKPDLIIIESLMRHLHSLSRSFADAIARAFRDQLRLMQERQNLTIGDLFVLTAISSIYPTSDHFHQIVTPAITIMARWLSLASPSTAEASVFGAYIVALCIRYQSVSKRYTPEVVRFTTKALALATDPDLALSHINNLTSLMDLWSLLPSFTEIFTPTALHALSSSIPVNSLPARQALKKLHIHLAAARLSRRPLELHHHRPLAIKMAIPKFEDDFNPDKHYDADRERAEAARLRKEYKREKKGAVRELKKDASFLARERLRTKKEADRAYEEKQRKLVAEIQAEGGRERNEYEREKRARTGKRR